MRSRSKHYNQQHPAIGYVACPTCHVPSGQKCIKTNGSQQNTETHVSRVKLYIKEFPDGVTPAAAFAQTPTPSDPNDRPVGTLGSPTPLQAAASSFEPSQR